MLFAYVNLPEHSINKLQHWIDQIYLDVWCNANPDIEYSIDLLPDEIKEIVLEIYNNDRIITDYLYGPIEQVYKLFQYLDQSARQSLAKYYIDNNQIEDLCKGTDGCIPFLYSELYALNSSLKVALEKFFKSLFDSVIHLESVQKRIGTIEDHYNVFMKTNNKGKCPFCGLNDIDSEHAHTREAYDHYLPKSKYPFSSINFRNLAPICNKCNSGNKLAKDPLHDINGNRRKAFYSYNPIPYTIEINLRLSSPNIAKLTPQDITITFGPDCLAEELQTWNELFGIDGRYKDKCCSADAVDWITQIFDYCGDKSPKDFLSIILEHAQRFPYSNTNFLRKAFLEACEAQHIFE